MILPSLCLLVAAAPAWSQVRHATFEGQLDSIQSAVLGQRAASVQAAATDFDKLLAALRDGTETEKLAALETLAGGAGSIVSADQSRAVAAVRAASESAFNAASVRAKSLRALGKMEPWLSDDSAKTKAVEALVDAASVSSPSDARYALRGHALFGLADAAKTLPFGDRPAESIATATLDVLRDPSSLQDHMPALLALHNLLGGDGAGVFWRNLSLAQRAEQELIVPLETNVDALYANTTVDQRYLYVRVLFKLAGIAPYGQSVKSRVSYLLQNISQRETDTTVRLLARSYAEMLQR